MRVKIFHDSGARGLERLEKEINGWLEGLPITTRVIDKHTAMCTVADDGSGERYQMLAITIWYE